MLYQIRTTNGAVVASFEDICRLAECPTVKERYSIVRRILGGFTERDWEYLRLEYDEMDELTPELVAVAKKILNSHVRRLYATEGRKRAANFARQMARHAFTEAGISLVDECSVHDEHGEIKLTANW